MCNEYNGWSNYPTWAVSLWIDFNPIVQDLIDENVEDGGEPPRPHEVAEYLKDYFDECYPMTTDESGPHVDIATWALSMIDWIEIARTELEDCGIELD